MPTSSGPNYYFALIPALAILGTLDPIALGIIAAAVGIAASLKQLH